MTGPDRVDALTLRGPYRPKRGKVTKREHDELLSIAADLRVIAHRLRKIGKERRAIWIEEAAAFTEEDAKP